MTKEVKKVEVEAKVEAKKEYVVLSNFKGHVHKTSFNCKAGEKVMLGEEEARIFLHAGKIR